MVSEGGSTVYWHPNISIVQRIMKPAVEAMREAAAAAKPSTLSGRVVLAYFKKYDPVPICQIY